MRKYWLIVTLVLLVACGQQLPQVPQVPPQAAALGQAAGLPQVPQLSSTAGLVAAAAGALGPIPCTGGLPGLATGNAEAPPNANAITANERAELEQLKVDLRAALLKADRAEQDRIDARAGQLRAERALAAATKQAAK